MCIYTYIYIYTYTHILISYLSTQSRYIVVAEVMHICIYHTIGVEWWWVLSVCMCVCVIPVAPRGIEGKSHLTSHIYIGGMPHAYIGDMIHICI